MPVAAVALRQVSKSFGDVAAVDGVDLDIADGEFFAMLGPSGSGKTTMLRMIAGFEQPSSGTIELHGTDVTGLPPFDRDVNTVFQDYALFPHMSILDNIGYGLLVKKVPRLERERRVSDALDMVRLSDLGDRKPAQLSGGQRQRIALARALVNRPRVLLLDEPLGALDLKLREEMQVELKKIQREVGITFVFVTHDQGEALAMSDRVAVFSQGRIEQVGSPRQLYDHPATHFVARFVGTSNILSNQAARAVCGRAASISIRPERIRIVDGASTTEPGHVRTVGSVTDVQFLGAESRVQLALDAGGTIVVTAPNAYDAAIPAVGARATVDWHAEHMITLAEESAAGEPRPIPTTDEPADTAPASTPLPTKGEPS